MDGSFIGEYTAKEFAGMVGCSMGAVYSKASKIRNGTQECIRYGGRLCQLFVDTEYSRNLSTVKDRVNRKRREEVWIFMNNDGKTIKGTCSQVAENVGISSQRLSRALHHLGPDMMLTIGRVTYNIKGKK
jgi:hypothetical protein